MSVRLQKHITEAKRIGEMVVSMPMQDYEGLPIDAGAKERMLSRILREKGLDPDKPYEIQKSYTDRKVRFRGIALEN